MLDPAAARILAHAGQLKPARPDQLGLLARNGRGAIEAAAALATGDLGMLDADGRLTVLGRTDDMVVVGGENIYIEQVEDILLEHPSVEDAAVVVA